MVNVYTRIPEELVRQLRIRAAERGVNQPAAIEAAIRQWVEGNVGNTTVTSGGMDNPLVPELQSQPLAPEFSTSEYPWVKRLLSIIRSSTAASRATKWYLLVVAQSIGIDEYGSEAGSEGRDADDHARAEIEAAQRLINGSEKDDSSHSSARARNRRTG